MAVQLICLLALTLEAVAGIQKVDSLADVHRIYVSAVGHDDETVRFRNLLEQDLAQEGFTIVEDASSADAVLSGVLSVRVLGGHSKAYASMSLKAADGSELWSGNFKEPFWRITFSGDAVKVRARDIAKKLHKDSEHAVARQRRVGSRKSNPTHSIGLRNSFVSRIFPIRSLCNQSFRVSDSR